MFSSNSSQASVPNYIEEVFSTYLYTGNSPSSQSINNGIDLSTKGGLVWLKDRSTANFHSLFDTNRGAGYYLSSSQTSAQSLGATTLTSFDSSGFSLGGSTLTNDANNYASWTFRKQPKFFDVVTYTGTGSNTTIAHSLGAVPGSIIVKRTDTTAAWAVYHRSLANTQYLVLNTQAASATGATWWNSTTPTSSVFSVGTDASVNASGGTYVAYLFAHDAGGFGLAGTDNVISCGTYTGNGSTTGPIVTLGYEPQWLLVKRSSTAGNDWILFDNMRGMPVDSADSFLRPNTTTAEDSLTDYVSLTATGFNVVSASSNVNTSGNTYIYIAIRRGPMKVPTVGTSVFSPNAVNVSGGTTVTTGFPVDWQINYHRTVAANYNSANFSRLRGVSSNTTESGQILWTAKTDAEEAFTGTLGWNNTGFKQSSTLFPNVNNIYWNFGRAPGFFDEVCYTGNGGVKTVEHNLAAVPELMIVKSRSANEVWSVYSAALGNNSKLLLNTTAAFSTGATWDFTFPTSSVFTVGDAPVNTSAATYVAYLFATCAGVSKVGSYTGNGTTQTINCGFTGGARFVLIKRTDSTGDWYVWDTARGIIAGNDPYLLLNSTNADVTGTDYVDTAATGFEISSTAPSAINASAGTFIFLAIA